MLAPTGHACETVRSTLTRQGQQSVTLQGARPSQDPGWACAFAQKSWTEALCKEGSVPCCLISLEQTWC